MTETTFTEAEVDAELRAAGVERDAATTARLVAFLELLVRWNRVHNLTGTRNRTELVARHLVESLALEPFLVGHRIADVGSGAGFPGLPLAISAPGRTFTLIESREKRASFLRHVAATLGLANVVVAHARAEDLPVGPPFDTVLARAVARPARLLELVRPLTAAGSLVLLLTSAERARAFADVKPGFRSRPIAQPEKLASTIVVLERV